MTTGAKSPDIYMIIRIIFYMAKHLKVKSNGFFYSHFKWPSSISNYFILNDIFHSICSFLCHFFMCLLVLLESFLFLFLVSNRVHVRQTAFETFACKMSLDADNSTAILSCRVINIVKTYQTVASL